MLTSYQRLGLDRRPLTRPGISVETARSLEVATARSVAAMQGGNLLSTLEARLLAGPEARRRETLYSIARQTTFEHGGDTDEVLAALERRFRGWR